MEINNQLFSDLEISALNKFKDFCLFIELYTLTDIDKFFKVLRHHLLQLYEAGLTLSSDYIPDENLYSDQLDKVELQRRINNIADHLINHRFYFEIFDPSDENDNQPVYGDIIDDIEDIYSDIKNTLLLLSLSNEVKPSVMWQFEFQFRSHWGDHAVNALRASHYFIKKIFNS